MSARIFSYKDANPVTFHIQPYFPANAVTDFISSSFTSTYSAVYAVVYAIVTYSFTKVDPFTPVLSVVQSGDSSEIVKFFLSGPWDVSVFAFTLFAVIYYLHYRSGYWKFLKYLLLLWVVMPAFLAAPVYSWTVVEVVLSLCSRIWGTSLITKLLLPLVLYGGYKKLYTRFVVYQHLDAGKGGTPADAWG